MMQRVSPGVYRGVGGRLITPRFGLPRGASMMGNARRPAPPQPAQPRQLPTPGGQPQMSKFQPPLSPPLTAPGGGQASPYRGFEPQPSRYIGDYYGGRSIPSFASGWSQQFSGDPYSMPDGQSEYVQGAQQQVAQQEIKPGEEFSRGFGNESSGGGFDASTMADFLKQRQWRRISGAPAQAPQMQQIQPMYKAD